jgi:site-specific recombinase XerD
LKLFHTFIEQRQYSAIDGPTVIDFQRYLKKERDNSGGSINRKLFTLKSYAHYLRLEQAPEAESLPFEHVLKIRQGYRNRPQALTVQQVKRLFDAMDRSTCLGIRDYAVYALMYMTGLRVGEVNRLDLKHVDFENLMLTVIGKGNKMRKLPLQEELSQVLAEYIAVRKSFCGYDQSPALLLSKKGNRLSIRTMEDNWKRIVGQAQLDTPFPIVCHTLRHTFASHLNEEGEDILVIQTLMGHASTRSTESYIHPSKESIRKAMEKLPAVIHMNELIERGVLNLSFQRHHPKLE